MILGIDGSNIRGGGGVTHLVEMLRVARPIVHGFSKIVVWSGQGTLNRIENRPWLVKSHQPILDKSLLHRIFWQSFMLSKLARAAGCNVLFVPGGSYAGDFRPMVTMSRNLLPFEWRELRRYGWSLMTLKLLILRLIQSSTFRRANGLIFLTQYARDAVMRIIKSAAGRTTIIPHGLNDQFSNKPREQKPISQYSNDQPFRILYVSVIDLYKHQLYVAEAVVKLRKSGLPVVLDLVGPASTPVLKRLRQMLGMIDPAGVCVRYSGIVPYGELYLRYNKAELFLFASSCESFGQILLEAMCAGLPIACSNRSAMPELLGNAGFYFDPERPDDIAHALRELINSPELRARLAQASFDLAEAYSWTRCAKETFGFISQVARVSSTMSKNI